MSRYHIFRIICLVVIVLLTACGFYFPIFWTIIVLVVVIYVTMISFMSMNISHDFFLKARHYMPYSQVMLTFDDGPHPEYTDQILDILKRHEIRAAFFLIGQNVKTYPAIVKRMISEGHFVGGHTMHHQKSFGWMSYNKTNKEIMEGLAVISAEIGKSTLYFRPPFGVTNPKIAKIVKTHKLRVVGWSVRSFDTVFSDTQKLQNRLIKEIVPGKIVLLHDRLAVTVKVLESVIIMKKKEGVIFDILPEMKCI